MHIDGACHCGAIRFSAEIDPAKVRLCHCTDCQALSGPAFRVVVTTPIESFAIEGTPRRYVKVADSGHRRAQVFCGDCGTPLYACAEDDPTWVSIRLGSVRQRAQLAPTSQIWCQSALPWVRDLASLPGSPGQQALAEAPR